MKYTNLILINHLINIMLDRTNIKLSSKHIKYVCRLGYHSKQTDVVNYDTLMILLTLKVNINQL